ncbi:helix-turn-helix domain-containing protein [Chitinophaga varians]|uniref:helix-turn-helix domain-containing protein n=1 Tax=Chitinophaga varians TaxID=2202339 RepID=UPI00165FECF4|nr:AraC family transcriptional regulator [Chitinophaga varians]MBC9909866.1 helix-turn-helix transcriptional regulator [Chitinophaga varians]
MHIIDPIMQVHRHIPTYPLSDFIQHIVYVSGSLSIPYIKELPEGGINLVIELNENTLNTVYPEINTACKKEVKNAWISGMQKQAILYKNNPHSTIISVRFTVGGFFSLTKIPISALDNVGVEAEAVFGSSFMRLYEKLLNATAMAERFSLIENYFLQYSVEENMGYHIVRFINQHIDKPIDWLIQKSGYSQKHVIHLLKTYTGFSPKYLQRIHRLQQVITEIQKNKTHIDWFSIIHRYGYFDQAHLIKDFAHFSGLKPTEYLRSQLALDENELVPEMILQFPNDHPDAK